MYVLKVLFSRTVSTGNMFVLTLILNIDRSVKSDCEIISISKSNKYKRKQSNKKQAKPTKKKTLERNNQNYIHTCVHLYTLFVDLVFVQNSICKIIRKHGFCLRLWRGFISSGNFKLVVHYMAVQLNITVVILHFLWVLTRI